MKRRRSYKREYAQAQNVSTAVGVIQYDVFRSPRRRTMELSLYEGDRLRAVVPNYVSDDQIKEFILARAGWIEKRLREAQVRKQFIDSRKYETGHEFLFLGRHYPFFVQQKQIKRSRMVFDDSGWMVDLPPRVEGECAAVMIKKQLVAWYRSQALEVFGGRVFHFSRQMGIDPLKVMIRGQKQVWGTCSYTDRLISLNWKLIMAPLDVVDYVVVHELAHLQHPNHSKKFWTLVGSILPEYQIAEDWLKHHRLEMALP